MFITNEISVDYLTHSSWNPTAGNAAAKILDGAGGVPFPSKWLQYDGMDYGSCFIGSGEQEGVEHHIIRASGWKSHTLYKSLLQSPGKPTRLDIQFTVEQKSWKAHALRSALRAAGVRARIYENANGVDHTVYIGSRSSDRFYRIYPKYDDNENLYVRLEVELKGYYAAESWRSLVQGEYSLQEIMRSHVEWSILRRTDKMNYESRFVIDYIKEPLFRLAQDGVSRPKPMTRKERNTKSWLYKSVMPSIVRLAIEHPQDAKAFLAALDEEVSHALSLTDDLHSAFDVPTDAAKEAINGNQI